MRRVLKLCLQTHKTRIIMRNKKRKILTVRQSTKYLTSTHQTVKVTKIGQSLRNCTAQMKPQEAGRQNVIRYTRQNHRKVTRVLGYNNVQMLVNCLRQTCHVDVRSNY